VESAVINTPDAQNRDVSFRVWVNQEKLSGENNIRAKF
jgi:hypothetical protein